MKSSDIKFDPADHSFNHALIRFHRQYHYSIPFHRFAACPGVVQVYVQKPPELTALADKLRSHNHLHFWLCTAEPAAIAPILCVDVF